MLFLQNKLAPILKLRRPFKANDACAEIKCLWVTFDVMRLWYIFCLD